MQYSTLLIRKSQNRWTVTVTVSVGGRTTAVISSQRMSEGVRSGDGDGVR